MILLSGRRRISQLANNVMFPEQALQNAGSLGPPPGAPMQQQPHQAPQHAQQQLPPGSMHQDRGMHASAAQHAAGMALQLPMPSGQQQQEQQHSRHGSPRHPDLAGIAALFHYVVLAMTKHGAASYSLYGNFAVKIDSINNLVDMYGCVLCGMCMSI